MAQQLEVLDGVNGAFQVALESKVRAGWNVVGFSTHKEGSDFHHVAIIIRNDTSS